MSTGNPLEQLRRRMQSHATPTAFAALAEEHRRAGRFDEAIAVCRDGLARYPAYVSARVTLGRALLDSGDVTAALTELEHAVAQAPDNLAAARALESAHTALGNAPPPPPLAPAADVPLRVAHDETTAIRASVVAQALGSGPDVPQEFGLGPDWSIPGGPAEAAPDGVTVAAVGHEGTDAFLDHAEAPTMDISRQHLQGDEPAGIWQVPGSGAVPAHDSLDAARVFSWALDPPPGEERAEPHDHGGAAMPAPASLWDEPTIAAPIADVYMASVFVEAESAPHEAEQSEPAPVAFEPFGTGSDGAAEESMPYQALSAVEPFVSDQSLMVVDHGTSSEWLAPDEEALLISAPAGAEGTAWAEDSAGVATAAPETIATAEPSSDAGALALAGTPEEHASPFWSGAFGGEAEVETPAPFSGWGDQPPPEESGADRSPWADEAGPDQNGPWAVPDGPSAAWALGDLHEVSGADVTPFAAGREAVVVPAPAPSADPEPVAADAPAAPPADVAWEGSVKSALGEVFARAGHAESLEPPAHPSPAVRTAMADAAVEAALDDAALRDDAPTPALASLQQMLDSVRARRAALFGDLHS